MTLEGLSLFFPCHNEEGNVATIIRDALRVAPTISPHFEVIIIDDGSSDKTSDIVKGFCGPDQPVRLVRHEQRKGYGEALRSGFRAARYPWIFFSDGDCQFDLSELPRLVERTDGIDMVSGYRAHRADPWHRIMNSTLYALALRGLLGLTIPDVNCAFKLYRREVFDRIRLTCSGALINAEIFVKARKEGFSLVTLPVSHRARSVGRPTGAQLQVIVKSMKELILLWWDIRIPHEKK